ncbi:MAG: T9SS type A sorting domain-containing protein [Saprospirales bacterium]|nr:T9SS type A sorting domain-containing protein [Saprospirales bacterium]
MKKTAYSISCFFLFLFVLLQPLSAQNKLTVINPQWGWWEINNGTIDEAVYTLKPQGLYVEVGLYFTFSWPENPYDITDSLEIAFDFNLPKEAIVTDSWLWVGDQAVQAEVWEVWTALQTYEEIVDRRQDPSILYEKPEGGHQLRIYPLVTGESRKVKISYLLPAQWTQEEVIATLPTEFLSTSEHPVNSFRVLLYPDPAWQNYQLKGVPGLAFEPLYDPEYGQCLEAVIPYGNWGWPLKLVMDTPIQPNGLFVGRHAGVAGNVYELAYFPQTLPPIEKTTHLMVAVEYKNGKSDMTFPELLATLRAQLKTHLDDTDFFNLAIGNSQTIYTASQNWIPADEASIDFVFNSFTPSTDGSKKPLINLLTTAGNLIVNNGEGGEMLLVSNTDEYYAPWYANPAMETFMSLFQGAFPVHICDYQSKNFNEYWANWWDFEPSHYGNDIFNSSLSTLTGGTYFNLRGQGVDFQTNLTILLSNYIEGIPILFDLDVDLNTGFSYQRYLVNYLGQSEYAHHPILQVGRYEGAFPMTVEFFALVDGQLISEILTVEENQVVELDTLAQKAWVGNHFQSQESTQNDPNEISQLVDMSIENRVLSKYTAFIALDPNVVIEPCYICPLTGQGPAIVEVVEEKPEGNAQLQAFPNPFSREVTIQLEGIDAQEVRIFDHTGRLVRILEPAPTLLWDGRNGDGALLPAGLYIVVVIDERGKAYHVKLVKGG